MIPPLTHRIDVEAKAETTDPATGYRTRAWEPRLTAEPAAWLDGPGREYMAAESIRSEIRGRFVIRWSPEAMAIEAGDRVKWDGRVMALVAPPQVDKTARREITLMVAETGSDGA